MDNQNDSRMVDISSLGISCSDCGTPIEKLPFMPRKRDDGTFGELFCGQCIKQHRKPRRDFSPRG